MTAGATWPMRSASAAFDRTSCSSPSTRSSNARTSAPGTLRDYVRADAPSRGVLSVGTVRCDVIPTDRRCSRADLAAVVLGDDDARRAWSSAHWSVGPGLNRVGLAGSLDLLGASPGCWMPTNIVRSSGVTKTPVISQTLGPTGGRSCLLRRRVGGQHLVVAEAGVRTGVDRAARYVGLDPGTTGTRRSSTTSSSITRAVVHRPSPPRSSRRRSRRTAMVPSTGRITAR